MYLLEELIKKYNAGQCTDDEKAWLEQWYLTFEWSDPKNAPERGDHIVKAEWRKIHFAFFVDGTHQRNRARSDGVLQPLLSRGSGQFSEV